MAGSKSLPDKMAEHVRDEFLALIGEKFSDPDGKPWSQERIGEAMGVSQTQVSEVRNGKNAGTNFLIALSRHTGKTINQLLGPTAPSAERIDDLAAEAINAAAAFVEIHDRVGHAYQGKLGERYRAMRELVARSRRRAGIWMGGPDPELLSEAARVGEVEAKRKRHRKAG